MMQSLNQILRSMPFFIWTLPFLPESFITKGHCLDTPALTLASAEAPQKEYLVVMLHGIGGDKESISSLMPKLNEAYQSLHPDKDISTLTDRLEFYMPTAKNSQWFKLPDPSEYPGIMFSALVLKQSITHKLQGFRESLIVLNNDIDNHLNKLNLGRDRLIIGGLSQGAMAAMTFGLESKQPVKAIISAIGMWMPCDINSSPLNMLLTDAGKDELVPCTASSKAEDLLKERLAKFKGAKTNLQILNFPEDSHEVSSAQAISILKFLDETVFEVKPRKFSHNGDIGDNGDKSSGSEEKNKDANISETSSPDFSELPESEQSAFTTALIQQWGEVLMEWSRLKERHEVKEQQS